MRCRFPAYAVAMSVDHGAYRVGRGLATTSRPVGFAVVALSYLAAGLAAWSAYAAADGHHHLTRTLLADVGATAVVFVASCAVGNASVYDPYWSVAPVVIVAAWTLGETDLAEVTGRQVAVLALVSLWGIRLTANWASSWRGLGHEDWRYVQLRQERPGRLPWWLINLTGVQMMPTLVVFTGLLAVWPAVTVTGRPWGLLDVAAVAVTGAAIVIEAAADRQMRRFAGDPGRRGRILDQGLWRYSRHPNYLGEIAFWWGMWLFGLAAAWTWWWTLVGPVTMVLLFMLVSIPLMDRRSLARRSGYAEHMRLVPALLPRRPR